MSNTILYDKKIGSKGIVFKEHCEQSDNKKSKDTVKRSLVLCVSIGTNCYRHIQIGEDKTLIKLHQAIIESINFDDDHLHSFFMNNRIWDEDCEYICPNGELSSANDYTDRVKLSKFQLKKGDKFIYVFDYGDEWRFKIEVIDIIVSAMSKWVLPKI